MTSYSIVWQRKCWRLYLMHLATCLDNGRSHSVARICQFIAVWHDVLFHTKQRQNRTTQWFLILSPGNNISTNITSHFKLIHLLSINYRRQLRWNHSKYNAPAIFCISSEMGNLTQNKSRCHWEWRFSLPGVNLENEKLEGAGEEDRWMEWYWVSRWKAQHAQVQRIMQGKGKSQDSGATESADGNGCTRIKRHNSG